MTYKRTRVLIVDDSALIRQLLTCILTSDPQIEVIGSAADPVIARDMIKQLNPDVLTLDIEMPRMDGLAFLEKIMTLRPMPVLMISSLTQKGAEATLRALELGAVDFVSKPCLDVQAGITDLGAEIIAKVKSTAQARLRPRRPLSVSRPEAPSHPAVPRSTTETIIAIGASTGGTEAIAEVLEAMPATAPGIIMTQHMPAQFTKSFAANLDRRTALTVREAEDGMRILPGHAYLAPGDQHLRLKRSGAGFICQVGGVNRISGSCPSVDVLFSSVADIAGRNAIGLILTGMGKDGAAGLLAMRRAGARTLGQDEDSCVVYGMPHVAFAVGAVEEQVSPHQAADRILKLVVTASTARARLCVA